ncbi:hypothetical protein EJ04DRAFT_519982 [Polyplosphaeria fusca]|uniref:RNA helicase n=1 Tax=Polyplosphaeria fusca TaxID=682080 RepID=A0A9P4R997_9PLEO|nr:hypothetical protein EJ04DRAFT_519982 [Polyplosphaeria fusca]
MHGLATWRSSLCRRCPLASGPRPRPFFLPIVQVAHRSTIQRRKTSPNDGNDKQLTFAPPKRPLNIQVHAQLQKLRHEVDTPEHRESLGLTPATFDAQWTLFARSINTWIRNGTIQVNLLARDIGRANSNVATKLRYLFHAQVVGQRFTQAELENQKALADLQWPTEWYPATREIPRTVHLHVGPTNSGKTYHALKRLEEAEFGIYLGPLRLLAHEVYTRLNAKGKPCALVTGEEQRIPDGDNIKMWSCTVEMAPLNRDLDVAVIDEIQMINHAERGWAWTQAFLGIKAREVHACGEARTVPIIKELCALVGDEVKVHHYERLTPLKVSSTSLRGDLGRLEKGDCVVVFSVLGIHAMRRQIEKRTNRKCAIVYGSLPPETRAQQARLFNDPDNDYDYLVASDAIGMGLNLSIKRIVFESTMKSNGIDYAPLQISEIKQIGGRAGRYRTAHQDVVEASTSSPQPAGEPAIGLADQQPIRNTDNATVGFVTSLEQTDHLYLQKAMRDEPSMIKTAGLLPPSIIVERFSNYFPPGTPFSFVLLRLHEISALHSRFHLCALKDQLVIADAIHVVRNLSIQERLIICAAPSNLKQQAEKDFLVALAKCIADNESGNLLDIPTLPLELLEEPMSGDRKYLYSLEQLHKMLVLYLWLSYRFPNVFTTRQLANHVKKLVEDKIEGTLSQFNFVELYSAKVKKREQALRHAENERSQAELDLVRMAREQQEGTAQDQSNEISYEAQELLRGLT